MRRYRETHPVLESRMSSVRRRMRYNRRWLERRTDQAIIPLEIQEHIGISNIRGEVLIVSRDSRQQRRIKELLRSENHRFDVAWDSDEAIGFLKLGKYRLVILDRINERRRRVFYYLRRYLKHIKVISIVNENRLANDSMKYGGYSFLLHRDFDLEQLRTCLISSLRLHHPVCRLLKNGETCNRSCINSYMTEENYTELEALDPNAAMPEPTDTEVPLDTMAPPPEDFFQGVE